MQEDKATTKPEKTPVKTPEKNIADAVPERRASDGRGSDDLRSDGRGERRASTADRRGVAERRMRSAEQAGYTGTERRVAERRNDTGLERRRGPGRRRTDDRRSAEEGEMTVEQFEFVMAIETYKKLNKRMFPTWTEILEVVEQLGYRKVEQRSIKLQDVPEPELFKPAA